MLSPFFLILLLLAISAFFSASETVIFSLSRAQIRRYQESKIWLVQLVGRLLENPRPYLSSILLGNEFANFALSMTTALLIARMLSLTPDQEFVASVAIITPLILLGAEMLPKNVAILVAPHIAPLIVPILHIFHVVIAPLRILLNRFSDAIVRLFGGSPDQNQPLVLEEEFRHLVDLGTSHGVVGEEEREIIHNVFEFTDKTAQDIMNPSEKLFLLPLDMPYKRMLEEIKATEYRRIPLYEHERNEIIGVLHVQSLFSLRKSPNEITAENIRELLHEPLFVLPHEPLELLLRKIQQMRIHMAIVRDAAGQVLGVVTLHDVLEALFGEIESDQEEEKHGLA